MAVPNTSPIADPADPRLAPYRMIRERDHVRGGTFIAEGEVVVRRLLSQERHRAVSVLLDETRAAAMAGFLATLPHPPEILVATRELVSQVAGFPVHRGCLALAERAAEPAVADLLPPPGAPARLLVAIGIANHDNMGGLFRNAAAFGCDAVLIDTTSCDPLYRKALRVSVGAALWLPFARGDASKLIDALEAAGITPLALSPSGATPLRALRRPARAALIVGAEGPGLPPEILKRCVGVAIPMAEGWDSLNVAVSAGIALHHLTAGA